MPSPTGPQFKYLKTRIQPFDEADASYDPQLVQQFNEENINNRLGDPRHSLFHEYGTSEGKTATAITKHHPGGIVLHSIHVNHDRRGQGIGTQLLDHLTGLYGKMSPSGHYVDQQALDWHNKNSTKFSSDPEYGGSRIVEDEEGW
jgi:GNAT superfamily N-acetyltransferase